MVVATTAAAEPKKTKHGRQRQTVQTGTEDAPAATIDAPAEAELERMTSRSTAGLVAVTRADGTVQVDLDGRFQSVAIAGHHGVGCHTGKTATDTAKASRTKPPGGSKVRGKKPATKAPNVTPVVRSTLEVR
ncbi:MAG: hypothetical protein M4D80_26115 [Myxococcota bacterium]|nr:hypothetical protein [Myxococcota bacterium]